MLRQYFSCTENELLFPCDSVTCYMLKVDSPFIDDYVWRPEVLHREGNPGHTITLIRVPHQELMVPELVWSTEVQDG